MTSVLSARHRSEEAAFREPGVAVRKNSATAYTSFAICDLGSAIKGPVTVFTSFAICDPGSAIKGTPCAR